ncbi:hypothetical protein N8069_01775 [Flavobacteriaceae bacterium]|nr:hypothetical protein [Flavobacteriaceae bacterium]
MKKLLLFTALASFTFASAQVTTNAGTFNKPAEGDTAFEMQFMPNLDGAAMFADNGYQVTMRKFESADKAVRWSASLNVDGSDADDSDMVYDLKLGYGVENHFAGAERLSTFWGYQGNVGFGSGEATTTTDPNTGDVTTVDAETSFSLGAGVFLGADYYIMPKVYVGVEMGYGLDVESGSDLMTYGLSGSITGMMRFGFRL